jgi:hypothetical protein
MKADNNGRNEKKSEMDGGGGGGGFGKVASIRWRHAIMISGGYIYPVHE